MNLALLLILAQVGSTNATLRTKDVFSTPNATVDLYVQPDGGVDRPVCTLAKPCKTLQYTWDNLVPFVTGGATYNINLADGTYNETAPKLGTKILTQVGGGTGNINIIGSSTMAQWTGIATGSTTVTQSAGGYAAASGITPAVVTDSTGTWTVNNLKGKYLTSASGATLGQRRIIASNTATTISLVQGFSASPVDGTTFTIDYPGAVFTNTVDINTVIGDAIGSGLALKRVAFKPASGQGLTINNCTALRSLTDVVAEGTNSNGMYLRGNHGTNLATITIANVVATTASSGSFGAAFNFCENQLVYATSVGTGGLYAKSTSGPAITLSACGLSGGAVVAETASGTAVRITNGGQLQSSTAPGALSRYICTSSGTGWDMTLQLGMRGYVGAILGTLSFEGCTTAVTVLGSNFVDMRGSTTTIANATNGFVAAQGAKIFLGTGSITYSTVTNQTTTDGVVLTQAAIDALTPKRQCATDGSCISRE